MWQEASLLLFAMGAGWGARGGTIRAVIMLLIRDAGAHEPAHGVVVESDGAG